MTRSAGIERSALVLSSTPPIPREYGNRNRVYQMIEFLKSEGFKISFLLFPFDEDWATSIPPYYRELEESFEYFAVIPNSIRLHQNALGTHHEIDEWWDDNIGRQLEWLFHRKRFDVFLVNYTFFSKALDYAPHGTLKILDTHDIFSGRREAFENYGVAPEFFYTTPDREKIAFDRSDALIAIKAAEKKFIATKTKAQVINIPYWDSGLARSEKEAGEAHPIFSHDRPLRLGFIGAQNSVNVVNMQRFLRIFDRYVRLYDLPVQIIVAGNVCRQLHDDYPFLKKLGRVKTIDEFYENIDAVIAPLEFSTGIKIKVGEALAWRLPVLATQNAFDGFKSYHVTQAEASVHALCKSVADLAYNEIRYRDLRLASHHAARNAGRAQQAGFDELRSWIRGSLKRLLVVVDRAFWYRATLIDEAIAQTLEYVSHISPVIVLYTCDEPVKSDKVFAKADYAFVAKDDVPAIIAELAPFYQMTGLSLVADREFRDDVAAAFAKVNAAAWSLFAAPWSQGHGSEFRNGTQPPVAATPLRYRPIACRRPSLDPKKLTVVVPVGLSEWESLALDSVRLMAEKLGLAAHVVEISAYYIYDVGFLDDCLRDAAKRVIVFVDGDRLPSFLLQVLKYRGVEPMLLSPTMIFPEATIEGEGLPSLDLSLETYLSGRTHGASNAGADTGWSTLWSVLSRSMEPAAALSKSL